MRTPIIDRARQLEPARRKPAAGATKSPEFALHLRTESPAPLEDPSSVDAPASLSALLGVQEVDDEAERGARRAAARYGNAVLDRLDELREDVLAGRVSVDRLASLAHALRANRELSRDPRLSEVIEEIELRAQVEIAKLTRSP